MMISTEPVDNIVEMGRASN